MSASFLDAALATPQARQGPSSRLLQRRSVLLQAPLPPPPVDDATPVLRAAADVTASVTAALGTPALLRGDPAAAAADLEVTRPAYAYQPLEDVTGGNPAAFGLASTTNLFVDFVSSSLGGGARADEDPRNLDQMLDQVAEYEELVQEHVDRLKTASQRHGAAGGAVGRRAIAPEEERALRQMQEQLAKERNTWRLIGKLFAVKAVMGKEEEEEEGRQEGGMDMEGDNAVPSASGPPQEKTLISSLMNRDEALRRAQTVVDWLEQNARDDLPEVANIYGDSLLGWENTHHTLLLAADQTASADLVSELDPDAKTRTRKQLHDCDEKDEQRLIRMLYMCQRAGMLSRAKSLCVEMGQPWRAATLVGWELGYDPNVGSRQEEKLPMSGNPRRDLWKKMAWQFSCNSSLPAAERAMYSALCGNAKQLLTSGMCSSWEDMLWAQCKAMVDTLVEEELRKSMPRSYMPMPAEYWDNLVRLGDIFSALRANSGGGGGSSSLCPYQTVQTHIILEDWPGLASYLSDLCDLEETARDPQLMRFIGHLIMTVLQLADFVDEQNVKDKVLQKFLAFLCKEKRIAQVAWYISQLHSDIQAETYSDFLSGVLQRDDRELCLTLGYEHGLPMEETRRLIVEKLLDRASDLSGGGGEAGEDEVRVGAVDWLLHEPAMSEEALRQGNAVARYFVAEHKPQLAGRTLEKVSSAVPGLPATDDGRAWLKELECLGAYVGAKESFSEWFSFYHQAQPIKPESSTAANAAEHAAHGRQYIDMVAEERRNARYQEELERWKNSLHVQSTAVIAALESVLTFPGGWLDGVHLEEEREDEEPTSRQREIEYLRRTCVVEVSLLLHTVLHKTMQYKRATEVADLVASEKLGLYALFSREDMRNLLEEVRQSFLCLMERNGGDPWAATAPSTSQQ